MVIEWGYVCATSSRFEVLRKVQMTRWFRVHAVSQIERFLQSKCARPTAVVLALFLLMPIAALAQGSPFPWHSGAHVPGRLHRRPRE
jgi:hypothetical protein